MPDNRPSSNARFSRKSLNIIIILTSVMILVFLNLPGSKMPGEEAEEPTPLAEDTSAELFSDSDEAGEPAAPTLESLAIIESKPTVSHKVNIQSWNTTGGAKVLFVESHEVPMLDIRLVFNAGSARDGDQPGTALFVNAMLNEGTERYSVDDIAKHFEGLGAEFSNGSYRDQAVASLRTLSDPEFRQPALDMFYEIVANPSFPDRSMERIREQLLISLEHKKQKPGTVASDHFYETLYQGHPYGIPSDGTTESLRQLTKKDLQAFHQRYYVASNAVIAIVGAVPPESAKAMATAIDNALPKGAPANRLPTPEPLQQARKEHIKFPSSQSHVLYGATSIKRSDPLRYALLVGNHILGGGGFTSRLNQTIRQDNGLAYSVYSYFSPMAVSGPFIMGLQTRNDQREEALTLMQSTLKNFMKEGPTQQELEDAKRNIINSFPLSVASNSNIVGNLGAIGFYDLPLDYLDTYLKKIEAVSVEDIKAAFRQTLTPETMLTVIVGPEAEAAAADGKQQ
ncbi:MAG: pitrilysin family protein [Ketobacteraceae bacterium]|nr:pitrilysin family protein [Ketobacteraceae bacterium]